jgi:isocitrate lyase
LGSSLDLITYSFLIPIIADIAYLGKGEVDMQTTAMIVAKRLVASGVVTVGQIALTDTIKKILKRFE